MKKTAAKIAGLILSLCLLLGYVNHVFEIKDDDGIYSVTNFYELEENTVDVLVLGSSHAYMSFNTGVLWREQGIASYVLAGSGQPMWNTYYYLKEALKEQTPRLIVLEGYRLVEEKEFTDVGFAIKNTYGLKWSGNRVDAIRASVPGEQSLGVLLGYTQYHDRYGELSAVDFTRRKDSEKYDDWKGFEFGMITEPVEEPDISADMGYADLTEKTEAYYRAVIELAQEKNIPVMVVIVPYSGITREEQQIFHMGQRIAQEYQVPFLNYNTMQQEMPIDYAEDMFDPLHLNGRGSCKFTSKWGTYIAEHYEIPDHRGDPAYDSWEKNAAYLYAQMEDMELREIDDAGQIPESIVRDRYDVFLSIDGYCLVEEDAVKGVLAKTGISDADGGGLWYLQGGDRIAWSSGKGENTRYFETDRHDFGLSRVQKEDGGYDNRIVIDNQRYRIVENGINVVVFDTITGEVADAFGIDADNGYQMCRDCN